MTNSTPSQQLRIAEDRVDAATVAERDAFDRLYQAVEADPDEQLRLRWAAWQGAESYEGRIAARRALRWGTHHSATISSAWRAFDIAVADRQYADALLEAVRETVAA